MTFAFGGVCGRIGLLVVASALVACGEDSFASPDIGFVDAPPPRSLHDMQLAFASNRGGSYDVYSIRADGTDLRQLTNDPDDQLSPTWSADGKQILFVAATVSGSSLIALDVASGVETPVKSDLSAVDFGSFSPDGTRIAVAGHGAAAGSDGIFTLDASGASQTSFGIVGSGGGHSPLWAGDNRVYYTSTAGGVADISSIGADGTKPQQITHGIGLIGHADVSRSARKVAYATVTGSQGTVATFDRVLGITTTFPTLDDFEPAISPDDRYVAVTTRRFGNPEIVILDITDGTLVQRITDSASLDGLAAFAP